MKSLPIRLPNGAEFDHLLSDEHQRAIIGAAAANRPLLIRGEPGVGKSQIAYAAASLLNRPLKTFTVNGNTESQDLLWSFDAVARLAESQILPKQNATDSEQSAENYRQRIDVKNFIKPGPLWWAIDWESAFAQDPASAPTLVSDSQATWHVEDGIVVLVDEIDKAESSVPNGLLEIFGARQLQPTGWSQPIVPQKESKPPLVIITTNEDRMLPTAFIRRCFVLEIELLPCVDRIGGPVQGEAYDAFINYFVKLAHAHFRTTLPEFVYVETAKLLFQDRVTAIRGQDTHKPGPAEYIDLLCAVQEWDSVDPARQAADKKTKRTESEYLELCNQLQQFVFRKNTRSIG
jgi:hypothetical protein